MKKLLLAAVAAWVVATPSMSMAAPADAQLQSLYKSEWAWRLGELQDDEGGRLPVPAHLPHVDAASHAARLAHWQDVLAKLDKIEPSQLSEKEQINAQVYRLQIANLIADEKFRDYEMPANSDSSFWGDFSYRSSRPFRTAQDYRNWLSQIKDLPRFFAENIANMRAGLARGFTPPRVTLEGRGDSIVTVANAKPEDTTFLAPFKDTHGALTPAEEAKLKAEAIEVVRTAIQPAYRDLDAFWRTDYLPHTRETLA